MVSPCGVTEMVIDHPFVVLVDRRSRFSPSVGAAKPHLVQTRNRFEHNRQPGRHWGSCFSGQSPHSAGTCERMAKTF